MKKIKIQTREKKLLADTISPVSIYLKLRDRFANSLLLESSDYHGADNSFSYICCEPIAGFKVEGQQVFESILSESGKKPLSNLNQQLVAFVNQFESPKDDKSYITTGLFGHINYDAVKHFDKVDLSETFEEIPLAQYNLYQFIIAFDHFRNECHVIEAFLDQPSDDLFDEVISLIQQNNFPNYPFKTIEKVQSAITDEVYKEMVEKGIHHCQVGDVFQVVLSRKFNVGFQGDEFQVYRLLRSVNPSPYLFYFDYGSYKLFGSSPEAQIVIDEGKAIIYPIAGTFKRTGDDKADAELAQKLLEDPKEDSEHVMLVDLARNDLSRSCENVEVASYKEVQYYSHVIHLVSKVVGDLKPGTNFMDVVGETFPAGTLSGAPKIRAMQIIEENEIAPRGFYGGAVGFMDFNGNFNHAIMIRSFLSHQNQLNFQAGAGIVAQSKPESELQEVYNKIGALKQAILEAEQI